MAEHEPEISILDQRLAEIDRRLSRIQVGLADEVGGSERPLTLAPALAVTDERDQRDDVDDRDDSGLVAAELRGLVSDQARLLDRLAELVSVGERLFADSLASAGSAGFAGSAAGFAGSAAAPSSPRPAQVPGPVPAAPTPPAATAAGALTVTAGPFASLDAVRAFERTLATLPGVASAEVRGYEGGDRAVIDVHLSGATS